jgi:spoIIIJ-associated protein
MKSLEVSGKNVEEATRKALEKLGVSRKEVEVTVVKEGRRGVLGLGAEEAVVRVRLLEAVPEKPEKPEKAEKAEKPKKTEKPKKPEKAKKAEKPKKAEKAEKPKKPEKEKPEKVEEPEKLEKPEKPEEAEKPEELEKPGEPEERGELDKAAVSVLEDLLARLELEAQVISEMKPPLGGGAGAPDVITLNVKGNDLGILIGRRGQTLAALQHIVRLIVANKAKARVPIVIDVEGYKQRRYEALQALARRMAEQVKTRGRPFALEPMPAYERRIIHLTLADDPEVATESTGDGEVRKVVIVPKKQR